MTETAEDTGTTVRTFRMFNDAWDLIGGKVKGARSDHSTFVRDMTDAGLDCARCYRCRRLVPVEFRDLTGRPIAEWVAEAGKVVTAQHRTTQHRNGHHPVTIGRTREWAEVAAAEIFGSADATVPDEPLPAPGSAVFLEPGGKPAVAAAVPQVPASSKKGREA